jgi:hypothetical protein
MIFKDILFYYLNWEGYTGRRKEMERLIKIWGIKAIRIHNPTDPDPLRQNRICRGNIKTIQLILENNIFPCIIIDDDVQLITSIPETIELNNNADFILLGGSSYNCGGIKPNMYICDYDSIYYRVYYMLGLHAILIPNRKSASIFLELLNESLKLNEFLDIVITMQSKTLLFLTPKDGPYFYQNNYNEPFTRFLWKDVKSQLLV